MDTKETISILNELYTNPSGKLELREMNAINNALEMLAHIVYRNEERTDFQGWPIKKLTMKDLRKFVRDNGPLDDTVKILVLEDDGMGYGANNNYCSDIYVHKDEDDKKEVQIWF